MSHPLGEMLELLSDTLPHLGKEMTSQTQNSSSHETKHSEVQAIRANMRIKTKTKVKMKMTHQVYKVGHYHKVS